MAISTATIERVGSKPTGPQIERLGRGVPDKAWKPYEPRGANRELMRDRSPELAIEGPADTGKSMACLNKLLLACLNYPGNRCAMLRKTRRSLTQSTMVSFEQKVLPAGAAYFHEGDQEYRFPNGSVCVAAGLDDPGKVFSTEFDFIYVNEADQITKEDYEALRARVTGRWGVMPYTQLLLDLNPTYPSHHLYEREKAGFLKFLFARHEDNPDITPQRIAALDSLTGWLYKRLRLGVRAAPEGMFFTEWNPDVHIIDPFPIPWHWTRWSATDYGYAAPFAHYAAARDPETKLIYVFRELYGVGYRAREQAKAITHVIKRERDAFGEVLPATSKLYARHVGDPSMFNKRTEAEQPSIADDYKANGIVLERAGNDRRSGWATVRSALAWQEKTPAGETVTKTPRVRLFRGRCPNLERLIPTYVHDPLDPEDLATEVNGVAVEDHPADAFRYLLVEEAKPAGPGVKDVRIGG